MAKTGSTLSMMSVAAFVVSSLVSTAGASAAGCQTGAAIAPYIGAADMHAIDRAAARLPAVRPRAVHVSIGTRVPSGLARRSLPPAVVKVLPQYEAPDYTAFRVGQRLAIVNPRGVLVYVMPIGAPTKPGNCP